MLACTTFESSGCGCIFEQVAVFGQRRYMVLPPNQSWEVCRVSEILTFGQRCAWSALAGIPTPFRATIALDFTCQRHCIVHRHANSTFKYSQLLRPSHQRSACHTSPGGKILTSRRSFPVLGLYGVLSRHRCVSGASRIIVCKPEISWRSIDRCLPLLLLREE